MARGIISPEMIPYQFKKGESGNPKGRPKNRVPAFRKKIMTKKEARNYYGITPEELNDWYELLLVATLEQLKEIAKIEETPIAVKAYAYAILSEMKQGKSTTTSLLIERLHGKATQRMELVGADGQPLIQEKNLTAQEAAELMREYDRIYKEGTLADTTTQPKPAETETNNE